MRMSCNGCRVLRKGCSDTCSIRPCLQWIKNPECQANATVFLAKFYGRAGLMNLINSGPDHLRPAIFRSLLYEACGRIVNPIYGSVGLLWSGSWQLCQAAVEAVLKGAPIMQISSETAANAASVPPLKAYDIRHVARYDGCGGGGGHDLHKVAKATRTRFKRPGGINGRGSTAAEPIEVDSAQLCNLRWQRCNEAADYQSDHSHESAHNSGGPASSAGAEDRDSAETLDEPMRTAAADEEEEVELDLTLGLEPMLRSRSTTASPPEVPLPKRCDMAVGEGSGGGDTCRVDLALDLPV